MPKTNLIPFPNKKVEGADRIFSAAAGVFLICNALKDQKRPFQALIGSYLVFRGASGHCPIRDVLRMETKSSASEIALSLTVNRPVSEAYQLWRNLNRLPLFMQYLKSVSEVNKRKSVWVAALPWRIGEFRWTAEITSDQINRWIEWESVGSPIIQHKGSVSFKAAGKFGTEIRVRLYGTIPGGKLGKLASRLIRPALEELIAEDLKNFRRYVETGEIPTTQGQPAKNR